MEMVEITLTGIVAAIVILGICGAGIGIGGIFDFIFNLLTNYWWVLGIISLIRCSVMAIKYCNKNKALFFIIDIIKTAIMFVIVFAFLFMVRKDFQVAASYSFLDYILECFAVPLVAIVFFAIVIGAEFAFLIMRENVRGYALLCVVLIIIFTILCNAGFCKELINEVGNVPIVAYIVNLSSSVKNMITNIISALN